MKAQRGIALVLVLTVLLALTLIATPFVLSMIMQEKTATAFKSSQMAHYAAQGVRNFAIAWLIPGNDYLERQNPQSVFQDPYCDSLMEFAASVNDSRLANGMNVRDEAGAIWGLAVQDEQGKVNLKSAPQALMDRLRTMVDTRVVSFKDYTTLFSDREAHWVYPQRIRQCNNVTMPDPNDPQQPMTVPGIGVDNALHYGVNMRVRITKPGHGPIETVVKTNYRVVNGRNVVDTQQGIPDGYWGGVIEVERRHPVNVNTAPKTVLIALMEGLTVWDGQNKTSVRVTRDQAASVADALRQQPVTSLTDLIAAVMSASPGTYEARAILTNAIDSGNAGLFGTGTMPFCFVSFDTVTIEAQGVVNNPSRVPVAQRGFREVVRLSPPALIDRRWDCQYDFDRNLSWGGVYQTSFYGYPYGNRVTTMPNLFPMESDRTHRGQQVTGMEAFVQVSTGKDRRGIGTSLERRHHYDDSLEGREITGGAVTWPWSECLIQRQGGALPDVAAGGMEYWIRFSSMVGGQVTFFDIREGDYENRISVVYDPNGGSLVYCVSDAAIGTSASAIDNGLAEIRYPFTPEPDTWYHIGAYWKGTRYAQTALLVDGFSHPAAEFKHVDETGRDIITELAADLTAVDTDNNVQLANDGFLPSEPTPIQIGQEVIIYDKSTGNHIRGARWTALADHPRDAKVQVFGYSSKVADSSLTHTNNAFPAMRFDRITTGGATVQYTFGTDPIAYVEGDKTDPVTNQKYIDDTQNNVPTTVASDMSQFPQKGYIRIDSEVIYYDGISGQEFTGCVRGQHGTTAATHNQDRAIRLWSVAVNTYGSAASDNQYLSPTILQIDDEWIGPVQKDPQRPGFWISFLNANNGYPLPLLRSMFGTPRQAHSAGTKVIPTWAAREFDNSVHRENCGPNDLVTLINNDGSKAQMRIHYTAGRNWVNNPDSAFRLSGGNGVQLVAFDDNVQAVHQCDNVYVRVLKFPSDELIGSQWLKTASPQVTMGPFSATIDEVKFFASPKGNFYTNSALPASGASPLSVRRAGGLPGTGAVKIGDEIVGYARRDGAILDPITRGWLHSREHVHDAGDYVFNLSFLPVSALRENIGSHNSSIPLRGRLSGRGYNQGYALIGEEVIGFESAGGNLWMPQMFNDRNGLFRGRFGTAAQSHAQDDLVYGIPWRYYDTYSPNQFDNRMAYWQVSTCVPDARWRRVTWEELIPQQAANQIELHCLVRVDGRAEWWNNPGGGGNFLWGFTEPNGNNDINQTGSTNQAGQLDIRFYVEYRPGSYNANDPWSTHAWKRTPKLYQAAVEYERATQTIYHEDW